MSSLFDKAFSSHVRKTEKETTTKTTKIIGSTPEYKDYGAEISISITNGITDRIFLQIAANNYRYREHVSAATPMPIRLACRDHIVVLRDLLSDIVDEWSD